MVQRPKLTPDQEIILEAFVTAIRAEGESPTFKEVAKFTGFTVSKVQRTVEKCVGLKLLKREPLVMNGLKVGAKYED